MPATGGRSTNDAKRSLRRAFFCGISSRSVNPSPPASPRSAPAHAADRSTSKIASSLEIPPCFFTHTQHRILQQAPPAAPDHQKQFPTSEKYGILQQGNLHISQKYSHERIDTPCATAVNSQRTHRLSPSFFNPSPYKLNAQKTPLPASGAFCAFLRLQKNSAPASVAKSPPPQQKPHPRHHHPTTIFHLTSHSPLAAILEKTHQK